MCKKYRVLYSKIGFADLMRIVEYFVGGMHLNCSFFAYITQKSCMNSAESIPPKSIFLIDSTKIVQFFCRSRYKFKEERAEG